MSTTASSFKVDKPSHFDGTKTKYAAWKVECHLFHLAHAKDIDTPERKIVNTLSYMKGGLAEKWRVRYVNKTMTQAGYVANFQTFSKELDDAFTESNLEQKAMDALTHLQQGRRTADEYTAEFLAHLSDAGIPSDRAAIKLYQDGLNGPIVDRIYSIIPLPNTLDSWIEHATQFDTQWRDRQSQKKGKSSSLWHNETKKKNDPDAMDVDKRQNRTAPAKLTPTEREKCFKEGRCFACREKGHNATNCPQKKQWGGQGANRGRTRAVREDSDEETPPSLRSRAQRPDNNPEPSSRTSEPVSDEDLPAYGRVESAHNRIRNILTTLPTDQRSEVASRLERDF
jgi:hypothetical protein